jgi:hypothetical protein
VVPAGKGAGPELFVSSTEYNGAPPFIARLFFA